VNRVQGDGGSRTPDRLSPHESRRSHQEAEVTPAVASPDTRPPSNETGGL
jgi:hypothetical protein